MTKEPEATVLLVSDCPGTWQRVIECLGLSRELSRIASREDFLSTLHRATPKVVIVEDKGVPGLAISEVIDVTQRFKTPIAVIVLGRGNDRPIPHVLRPGVYEYLPFPEWSRLGEVMQHAMRDMDTSNKPLTFQSGTAELLRENQKLVTIGRLSGSIAHEINNPLESVTNLLFLMESTPELPTELRGYLRLAQGELGRAVQITKQTLNFCRETVAPVRTSLEDLLEEVVVLYARKIAEKHLKVIRQFRSKESVVVFPGEIRQVFSNLISNAIEASSDKGKLYLRVRRSQLWGDPGVTGMRVTIADNGSGIPMEARRRIGEPFFTTKGNKGTGLGLWVTQSIIQRYGGNLLLCSNTGEHHGTVFSLFLPTNLRPHPVGAPAGGVEAARAANGRHLKQEDDGGAGRRQFVS